MARKTTGKTTTRSKKTVAVPSPVNLETTQESREEVVVKTMAAAAGVGAGSTSVNLQEEIRRRAYELYQRRAKAGNAHGDEHQDWFLAEREIMSRHNGNGQRP